MIVAAPCPATDTRPWVRDRRRGGHRRGAPRESPPRPDPRRMRGAAGTNPRCRSPRLHRAHRGSRCPYPTLLAAGWDPPRRPRPRRTVRDFVQGVGCDGVRALQAVGSRSSRAAPRRSHLLRPLTSPQRTVDSTKVKSRVKATTHRTMPMACQMSTRALSTPTAMSIGAVNAGGSSSGPSRLTPGTP